MSDTPIMQRPLGLKDREFRGIVERWWSRQQKPVSKLTDEELDAEILLFEFRLREFAEPWSHEAMICFSKEYCRSLFSIVGPHND